VPKLTFSLDAATAVTLRRTAQRLRKPLSVIVREAIAQYAAQEDTLSDAERDRLLGVLQQIKRRPPTRSADAVETELKEIRRARRTGWSRSTA
jgi:hypothetical protein